jgi:hypothetical protein
MEVQTRTIKVDAEVYVSTCAICGEEELATVSEFRRHVETQTGALTDKIFSGGWSYKSHSDLRVGKAEAWMPATEPQREWRLCGKHLEVMRDRVATMIAEERAKVL